MITHPVLIADNDSILLNSIFPFCLFVFFILLYILVISFSNLLLAGVNILTINLLLFFFFTISVIIIIM